jgi:hypothetical protein
MDPHRHQPPRDELSEAATLVLPLPVERGATRTQSLVACSICLRVLRGSDWIEAEEVIRSLRSYEHQDPPRLKAALCNLCAESIRERRAQRAEPLAA